jgi:hypothetical protein
VTITAEASTTIAASPQAILEFVLDLNRYRQVDTKIVRVVSTAGPDVDGHGSVKIWGRIAGLPPAPDRQNFTLLRWNTLTFVGAPKQPARLVFDFTGVFECLANLDGSTGVRHAYVFTFKGPFRLMERRLGSWLQREIEAEVNKLANVFVVV